MVRFLFLGFALLSAPLTAPEYLIPHVSHGCMNIRRALSFPLRPARVSVPLALQTILGKTIVPTIRRAASTIVPAAEQSAEEDSKKTTVHLLFWFKACDLLPEFVLISGAGR